VTRAYYNEIDPEAAAFIEAYEEVTAYPYKPFKEE
jgi:hypothetical protein